MSGPERGTIDADLGGGLIKQRSGGFRMIVAYRPAGRAAFLYAFAKSDRDNIDDDELEALRTIWRELAYRIGRAGWASH